MKTEAYFIGHCDDENCDLGSFDYTCPCCGKFNVDYDVWWKADEIYGGTIHKFECDKCKANLVVKWDSEEFELNVTKDEEH